MKLKLFSVLALSGLIAAGVACGDSSSDGEGGEGGSGGDTTSTTSTKGGTTTKTTGATMNTTGGMTTGMTMACDDIGGCGGDGMDPNSGCLECSIIGDDTPASDGGECAEEYVAYSSGERPSRTMMSRFAPSESVMTASAKTGRSGSAICASCQLRPRTSRAARGKRSACSGRAALSLAAHGRSTERYLRHDSAFRR